MRGAALFFLAIASMSFLSPTPRDDYAALGDGADPDGGNLGYSATRLRGRRARARCHARRAIVRPPPGGPAATAGSAVHARCRVRLSHRDRRGALDTLGSVAGHAR